ncbi:MAG: plasmid replication initiator TrfA [Rhodoferax sp.]|uniref:plasmid replication initiator TrfA n=1 Tax=Rhodoferax sp. TaxID=50421 RepID=UPI0026130982|nr:plasmid replication initiator TrfA [Rhodoferax sp.]MDD2882947.1 plasmid replication initiator TrfA [Rhodoferax sp.]
MALAKLRGQSKEPVELSELGAPGALVESASFDTPEQLPLWPEPVRGVPNSVLRSALFGIVQRGRRAFQQRVKKASVDGVLIIHTGPTLDQGDLDVWEQTLHLARISGLGTRIQFSANGFLKAIDRSTGGKDADWLKGAFARLASSVVEIQDNKKSYFGPMLIGGARNDESGRYVIEMNPPIVKLFGADGWSKIEFAERRALRKQPLAQWLHGFYSTHARPFAFKVETISRLSGSENQSLKSFKQELSEALLKLSEITGWTCDIDDADLVRIDKRTAKKFANKVQKLSTK